MHSVRNQCARVYTHTHTHTRLHGQVARNTEEKVRVLHRWVCDNISYNVEGLRSGNYGDTSADGVLRSRGGVCSGYATLFSALCREAGIEQREVSGVAKGSMWEGKQLCQ